jgi:alanine racemase
MTPTASLTIDLGRVVANWRATAAAAGRPAAAVVKADGYGLGAVPIARALAAAGCRRFFVAQIGEGADLRAALPDPALTIAVLNGDGALPTRDFADLGLQPVLSTTAAVRRWLGESRALGRAAPAMVHVDTGMNRLGLAPAEWRDLIQDPDAARHPWSAVISHLACADAPDDPMNAAQHAAFTAVAATRPDLPASLAASSGAFLGTGYAFDFVRPGAALHGLAPLAGRPNPLANPVRLTAPILQVRSLAAGDPVGYGAGHRSTRPTRVATVAVGYADGLLRAGSGRGKLRVAGRDCPILGRISMDLTTVDVTDLPASLIDAATDAEVICDARPPDAVAADAGTIGYELLTRLGQRFARRWIGGP